MTNESDNKTFDDESPIERQKDRYWTDQLDAIVREVSKLAVACNIDFFAPDAAERVLKNDESVCRTKNPVAFRKLREHLGALYPLEEAALERLGPDETSQIVSKIQESITALRSAGGLGPSPKS